MCLGTRTAQIAGARSAGDGWTSICFINMRSELAKAQSQIGGLILRFSLSSSQPRGLQAPGLFFFLRGVRALLDIGAYILHD